MSQLSAATVAKFRPELILNSADPDGPAMNPAGDQEVSATQLEMAPRRIPNLGHALLFVGFAGLMLVITQLILLLVGKSPVIAPGGAITIQYPKWQLAAMATTYLTTLLAAWLVYPVLWRRAFLVGLGWHWETARGQAGKLLGLGLFLRRGEMVSTDARHKRDSPTSLNQKNAS